MNGRRWCGLFALMVGACGITDAPPPDSDRYINITIVSGAEQVGLPGSALSEPIEIRLRSTVTNDPVPQREVRFNATSQSGITFNPAVTFTDANGIARTHATLGTSLGRFQVEVTFKDNPGSPATFVLETAHAPVVAQISPASVAADGNIIITGQNFSTQPDLNQVDIDGTRARVIAATSSRLDVRVPACLPTRTAQLVVRRGALVSAGTALSVTAGSVQALNPAVGQAVTVNGPASLACVRLGAQSAGAEYLVIAQHTANTGTTTVPIRLVGLRDGTAPLTRIGAPTQAPHHETFTRMLHEREAEIVARLKASDKQPRATLRPQLSVVPEVGERRTFRVFVPRQPAATISATARAVGKGIAIYEDAEAAGSMPQAEIDRLLGVLDDPVYSTALAVYGSAPDLDRNQRVIVLLTPAVNRLTQVGETSFISGFFDSCDLVSVNECSDTNTAEILYSMVPDPTGRWGLRHSVERVVSILPPLAAHEFQHLIHFNQRVLVAGHRTPEELWLNEAMAHLAEDTIAGVLRSRGLTAEANLYARENLIRASHYLASPARTSLIASTGQATIEERGAGWLFLKYLYARFGPSILRRIQTAPETGARNVAAVTGAAWNALLRDWSIALYAHGAAEFNATTLAHEHTYGSYDLRTAISTVSASGYTLRPGDVGSTDFSIDWNMAPATITYSRLTVPAGAGVNLITAGERGGDFHTAAQPQIVILRLR